jgi:hypothetical protein
MRNDRLMMNVLRVEKLVMSSLKILSKYLSAENEEKFEIYQYRDKVSMYKVDTF